VRIRPAGRGDLHRLAAIERAAGEMFATIGMPGIAADEPFTVDELAAYRAWVAVDGGDRPVAYVLVEELDGCAHVEQISVHPDAAGQGVGRRLLDTVTEWAAGEGLAAVTLTAFVDVAWNGPYYRRLGFRVVADDDLSPGLRARRDAEHEKGLDRALRACLRRDVR
jgi:GNAT superfamily N-acetyltransferase